MDLQKEEAALAPRSVSLKDRAASWAATPARTCSRCRQAGAWQHDGKGAAPAAGHHHHGRPAAAVATCSASLSTGRVHRTLSSHFRGDQCLLHGSKSYFFRQPAVAGPKARPDFRALVSNKPVSALHGAVPGRFQKRSV